LEKLKPFDPAVWDVPETPKKWDFWQM
jgi:hypothetical protein